MKKHPYDFITNRILSEHQKYYGKDKTDHEDDWARFAASKIWQTFDTAQVKKFTATFKLDK